jgi:hypothetical protein
MSKKSATRPPRPLSPFEAFKHLVYLYGVEWLASRLGYKVGTLYNKADADADSHHQPTLRDVVLTTELTGDMAVLDSLEAMFGRVAMDVAGMADVSDDSLLELIAKHAKENGEFYGAVHAGMQAKRFTRDQYNRIRAEAFEVVSAVMTLTRRAEGLIDE